ncbi:MAG: sigma-70 family RNA polymerase sigma factor [Lentisphaeraceae bacterium]|nr:sigma-70 family RNA polymerase sigma factor [Lentisphaeraceae bacterium]
MEDDEIIKKVLNGEYETYSQLVTKYNLEVVKVVSAMLYSYQEIDDLVQKTFIEAYNKLDRFEAGRDFGKWAKGIARNMVKAHLRTSSRSDKHIRVYQEWSSSQLEGDDCLDTLQKKYSALEKCFDKVSDSNRSIMELKYRKRLSIQAIADELNRSLDGITKALSRTRAELRTCVRRNLN